MRRKALLSALFCTIWGAIFLFSVALLWGFFSEGMASPRREDPDYEVFFEGKSAKPSRRLKREIEELISNFTKVDYELRQDSRSRLLSLGRPVLPSLLKELVEGNRSRAINAALIFSSMKYQKVAPALEGFIKKTDRHEIQAYAAFALGKVGDENSAPVLTRVLSSSRNHSLTLLAALALARLGATESMPDLLTAYRRASNSRVRAAILLALGRVGNESVDRVKPVLLSAASGKGTIEREAAVIALGDVGQSWGLKDIRRAVLERRAGLRIAGLAAISRYSQEEGEKLVRKAVGVERDKEVKRTALLSLGNFPREANLAIYQRALGEKDEEIRISAIFSLTAFGKTNGAPLCRPMLQDPSPMVRRAAALSLGLLMDEESIPLLSERTGLPRETHSAVRSACLLSLCLLQGEKALAEDQPYFKGGGKSLEKEFLPIKALLRKSTWRQEIISRLLQEIHRISGLPHDLLVMTMNELLIPILGLEKEMEVARDSGLPPAAVLTKQEQDVKVWLSRHPYFPFD